MKTKLTTILILLVSITSFSQTFTVDGLNYEVTDAIANQVSVTGGTLTTTSLTIPETVSDGTTSYTVTSVGNNAFADLGLTEVTLANTIESIGTRAFRSSNLTTITLPTNLKSIGLFAFQSNAITGKVVFPEGFTTLLEQAFRGCNITEITFPESFTTVGDDPFRGNNNITTIIANMQNPPEITIPGTANIALTIPDGREAAYEAAGWTGFFSVNRGVEVGDTFTENNFGYEVISLNPNEVELTGGTSILQDLIIETLVSNRGNDFTVTSIGANAIDGSLLTSITITATTPPMAVANAFGNNSAVALTVPDGEEQAYETAGWTGFNSVNGVINFYVGDTFSENNFDYEITSLNPNELAIIGGTTVPQNLIIPENVSNGVLDFVVTAIGDDAFKEAGLTSVSFPSTLRELGEESFRSNALTEVTIPEGVTSIPQRCFSSNDLTNVTFPTSLETIGFRSFESNNLTSLTLPVNLLSIGQFAFNGSDFNSITSLNPTPPSVVLGTDNDSFNNEQTIDLTIPTDKVAEYEAAGWTGFKSVNGEGDTTFEVDGISYRVTSLAPNEVEATGGSAIPTNLVLTEVVSFQEETFSVTSVGLIAFKDKQLTSVSLPNGLISIGVEAFKGNLITEVSFPESLITIEDEAFINNNIESIILSDNLISLGENSFQNNNLTTVTLPASIKSIGSKAFRENPLITVISESLTPATLDNNISNDSFGLNRDTIDLTVPTGREAVYLRGGWTGFNSINGQVDADFEAVVAPKVFLQGAATNPNTGEEDLMRDDLRVADIIPTTSPYVDALTVDETVFDVEGNDAIVDWVFVELRDATDNSVIVTSQSALIQRDGDVVAIDGISPLSITADSASYYIAIGHRNHLGILSANAIALSTATTTIDFTSDVSLVTGGVTALATLTNGNFSLFSGNFDGDIEITLSDRNNVITELGNISTYSNADMDLNGDIEFSDINSFLNPNLGNREQFSTIEIPQ